MTYFQTSELLAVMLCASRISHAKQVLPTIHVLIDGTIGLDALVQLVSDKITDPEPQNADQLSELFRMFDRVRFIFYFVWFS